ncbi:polysaccharide transporter [Schaalia odontolytica]|uniref:Polysaccharide transporter n=1 Tax=Schaalia odontolytica TaxID=1660 RepID=A0A0V8RQL7_9ACTO|nr:hypothetical protein [Schaalia odontolytica]KSW10444.1 polysaccharide transporter [Schaalia odontolytica]QCT35527.1 polysaccharide transporter [Schaalia odontolytica]
MGLMLPGYRYFGHMYFWPAWVHLIVIALMGVAATLTISALMARGVGRSRVFGLSCGFVAGIGNLSLCVLVQAEARHTWLMGMVGALYTVAFVFLLMTLVSLWSGGSSGFLWSRAFHLFLVVAMAIAGIMEFAYRLAYWIPLPVAGVAVLLALFCAFVAGRNSRD